MRAALANAAHGAASAKVRFIFIAGDAPQYETFEPTRKPGSSAEVSGK